MPFGWFSKSARGDKEILHLVKSSSVIMAMMVVVPMMMMAVVMAMVIDDDGGDDVEQCGGNCSHSARAKMATKVFVPPLIQYNMQCLPCNSALLAPETLFLTQKAPYLPKVFQNVRKSRQISISLQNSIYARA